MADERKWYVCNIRAEMIDETTSGEYEGIERAEEDARGYLKDTLKTLGKSELEFYADNAEVNCREATPSEIERQKKFDERFF